MLQGLVLRLSSFHEVSVKPQHTPLWRPKQPHRHEMVVCNWPPLRCFPANTVSMRTPSFMLTYELNVRAIFMSTGKGRMSEFLNQPEGSRQIHFVHSSHVTISMRRRCWAQWIRDEVCRPSISDFTRTTGVSRTTGPDSRSTANHTDS